MSERYQLPDGRYINVDKGFAGSKDEKDFLNEINSQNNQPTDTSNQTSQTQSTNVAPTTKATVPQDVNNVAGVTDVTVTLGTSANTVVQSVMLYDGATLIATAPMSTATTGSLTTAKISSSKFAFNASTGALTTSGGYIESSSIALKENVTPIANALDIVLQLLGVTYDRKDGSRQNEPGLIAEDVDKIASNLVSHSADGRAEGIHYSKLTAYLVEAIKGLQSQIDPLKEEIRKLKGE
jgi:hypothetical protein